MSSLEQLLKSKRAVNDKAWGNLKHIVSDLIPEEDIIDTLVAMLAVAESGLNPLQVDEALYEYQRSHPWTYKN